MTKDLLCRHLLSELSCFLQSEIKKPIVLKESWLHCTAHPQSGSHCSLIVLTRLCNTQQEGTADAEAKAQSDENLELEIDFFVNGLWTNKL